MSEWDFDGDIVQGTKGKRARLVQEWLCLHDVHVAVDKDYGPATAMGVRQFQTRNGLSATGTVNRATFDALLAPLNLARGPATLKSSLGRQVVAYAKQHLDQSPREIGGQNCGPWVRLYMKGNEGESWPWCAGFATYVLKQAADTFGTLPPVKPSFSCDLLAVDAQNQGKFRSGSQVGPGGVPAGSLFLVRRTGGDWIHTGIVLSAAAETFETIEGNTNDAGDREGYEVCRRFRNYQNKDFIFV